MIDYRIYTFLKLCEVMNYRKTAELLNMTQPSVTQHIKYLENLYNVNLFSYNNKVLIKTHEADILRNYALIYLNLEIDLKKSLTSDKIKSYTIGATKTIGEYILPNTFKKLVKEDIYNLSLIVDNTSSLLKSLDNSLIDIALIEGDFDRSKYDHSFFKLEKLIGICSKKHSFSNKEISIDDLLKEKLICREDGSGTKNILELSLNLKNTSIKDFKEIITISQLQTLKELVAEDIGISFVYESVYDNTLSTFKIKDLDISHSFNYVYLKNTNYKELINKIKELSN